MIWLWYDLLYKFYESFKIKIIRGLECYKLTFEIWHNIYGSHEWVMLKRKIRLFIILFFISNFGRCLFIFLDSVLYLFYCYIELRYIEHV